MVDFKLSDCLGQLGLKITRDTSGIQHKISTLHHSYPAYKTKDWSAYPQIPTVGCFQHLRSPCRWAKPASKARKDRVGGVRSDQASIYGGKDCGHMEKPQQHMLHNPNKQVVAPSFKRRTKMRLREDKATCLNEAGL